MVNYETMKLWSQNMLTYEEAKSVLDQSHSLTLWEENSQCQSARNDGKSQVCKSVMWNETSTTW